MTTSQHMLWMLDEFEAIHGSKQPGFITGKPVGVGGSQGRTEATGFGVIFTVREALKELGIRVQDTTAAIQGFGNVGQYAARLYEAIGGRVTAVSSWNQADRTSHTFFKKDGIKVEELLAMTDRFGEIDKGKAADAGYRILPGEAWIEQEVDILIPAALENQVNEENAGNIKPSVRILAEGANGPTSVEADRILLGEEDLSHPRSPRQRGAG